MENYPSRGSLVAIPPLDEPLVQSGGTGGGIGGVFQAGDELGQLVTDLLLGFACVLEIIT